ncbi:hypothetical protein Nepgr_023362 [Nepenthes gracilis]|uniref:Uncharacterized protein n=1 Tax=Nepenthes gracilis TaxID=150966 RepID=A0AAD3T2A6_NEPGR|nr:hypothetical protein Nepgr_023362 [Nepenthes gracilis]
MRQAAGEDPDDYMQWHQLGLHCLRTQQFKMSQKYLTAAVARSRECSYAWSNLGYAPAYNNLGLVFVAEGQLEEAKFCFDKALQSDPLLDAAKSNMVKVVALSRICMSFPSCLLQD